MNLLRDYAECFYGPVELLDEEGRLLLLRDYEDCLVRNDYLKSGKSDEEYVQYWEKLGTETYWFKSFHHFIPRVREIARHPSIVESLRAVLGPNIILWGSQILRKKPGRAHSWHTDVEAIEWKTVNVWVSLENTSELASLKLISGSAQLSVTPELLSSEDGLNLEDDDAVLSAARRHDPNAELRVPIIAEGEAVFFDGRTWHGSFNIGSETRTALLLQYSTPDVKVKIPTTFDRPVNWHSYSPPCMLVSGEDLHSVNRLVRD